MLQSSNQYLRPDYLAAPNTLDTKSSPLALLAQTCSAIGAESTNPKLAVIIEKSTKSMKSNGDGRDKTSPLSSHSSSSVSTGSVEQQQHQQQQQPPSQQQQQQHHQQQQQSQPKSSFKPYESNNNNNNNNNNLRDRMEADTERAHNLCTMNNNNNHNNNNNNNNNNNLNGQCHNSNTVVNNNSSHRVKTPKPTNGQHHHQQQQQQQQQQRCDSNQSATSQRDSPAAASTPISNGLRRTPSAQAMDLQSRVPGSSSNSPQLRGSSKESPASSIPTSASQTSTASQNSASATARLQAASDAAAYAAKEANYVKALHAAAAAASGNPGGNGGGGGNYYPGYGPGGGSGYPPMDLMTASALMNPHHPMFKAAALSPYLNYARLKGMDPATAAAMMSPNVCRDPFCTSCPASPHFLNKAAGQPCPAGCQQCDNSSKANAAMSGGGSQAAAAAAASYHAQLAALAAASQMPYVCSWIGTDAAYCGKRFGTSDELFQHLRTHTASMPDSVLSAAAAGGIPPNHPLFRTYPTPPLSPLSAAARYHPYGKPSMLPPQLGPPGMPMPPHPALAQYFSPYALYGGPRMGSSHP